MDKHEATIIIGQNSVVSPHFTSSSFVGRLHEDRLWDHCLFSKLSEAIDVFVAEEISLDLRAMLFDIYSYVVGVSLLAHVDPNDGLKISNVSVEEFYDLRNNFDLTFRRILGSQDPASTV